MDRVINLLLVEDSESDALVLLDHLKRQGLTVVERRVDNLTDLAAALAAPPLDLVLTDFRLPGTSGLEVLALLATVAPGLPCLVVSGQIGEEAAVDALRAGARDFISKDNLSRLAPAITRELQEAEFRRQQQVTEAELEEMGGRFRGIVQNIPDLVAIINSEGHRLFTSPSYQTILGYSSTEMADIPALALLHPDDAERVELALRDLQRGLPTQGLEYRLRHRDGRWRHFESNATLITPEGGARSEILVVARDTTERKEAEALQVQLEVELRQAQKLQAIGQLAAGIAHEINTPIQFVGDNLTFLQEGCHDLFNVVSDLEQILKRMAGGDREANLPTQALLRLEQADVTYLAAEVPKAIQQSLHGVARVARIVGAMKDFSHPGGEGRTTVDLNRALDSTLTISKHVWKFAATIERDFAPDLPLVPCFPSELNQVFLNLVVNAAHAIEAAEGRRAAGELGSIKVRTRHSASEVTISIADNGTGIPEAIRHRIFDPFFTTKAVGKGTGQGLAIVHAVVVEKHGGRITVDTEPGEGTTFHLHLPLHPHDPGPR